MLAHYATFSAANMAATDRFHLPSFSMLLTGAVISLIGMTTGHSYPHRPGPTGPQ